MLAAASASGSPLRVVHRYRAGLRPLPPFKSPPPPPHHEPSGVCFFVSFPHACVCWDSYWMGGCIPHVRE